MERKDQPEYQKLVKLIKENPSLTVEELAKKMKRKRTSMYYMLKNLTTLGVIEVYNNWIIVKKDLTNVK